MQEKGHFATVCQSAKKSLHTLGDEESFSEEESYDIVEETAHAISTVKSDQVLVTCTINKHHQVTFEIDTGASCNVLPFSDYVKSTGDKQGLKLKKTTTRLTMHNNSSEYPLGSHVTSEKKRDNALLTFLCRERLCDPHPGQKFLSGHAVN